MNHFDKVRAESRYDTWAGRPSSRASRFHHRVEAPALGAGFELRGVKRPDPAPALDLAAWEIHGGAPPRPIAYVNVFEYATLAAAHEELLQSLQSITRAGVDYAPLAGGPGDVCVAGRMVRDNLLVTSTLVDPKDAPQRLTVLRAIDAWLLDDWPLAAARGAGGAGKLDVALRVARDPVRVGEPVEVAIEVRRGGAALDLDALPHRIEVEPGTIERRGKGYVVVPGETGALRVSASVLGPAGEHGAGRLDLRAVR